MMLQILEGLSYLATALGIPAALFVYTRDRRRERSERYREAYASVDSAYLEFMRLCLENPDLDILREEHMNAALHGEGDAALRRRKWILYSVLISVLERAYVTLHDCPDELYASQWAGWEAYALEYLRVPECRRVWNEIADNFDQSFFHHMNNLLAFDDALSTDQPAPLPDPAVVPRCGATHRCGVRRRGNCDLVEAHTGPCACYACGSQFTAP